MAEQKEQKTPRVRVLKSRLPLRDMLVSSYVPPPW